MALGAALVPSACSSTPEEAPAAAPFDFGTAAISVHVATDPFGITVKNGKGDVILESLDGDEKYAALGVTHRTVVYKTHLVEGWDYQRQTDGPITRLRKVVKESHTSDGATFDLVSGAITTTVTLKITGAELRFDAKVNAPAEAKLPDDEALPGTNLATMAWKLPADEHFFGLGERLVTVDHRGTTYESWVEEGGIGGGEAAPRSAENPSPNGPQMSHAPIPFFVSTKGYGVWLDTGYRTGTSFGGERTDAWRFWATEPAVHMSIWVHDNPMATIGDFTAKTGRATLPAAWVFGPRRRMDFRKLVNGVPEMELLRTKKVPTTAADDATHFLPIGSQVGREADLTSWVADLHKWGFKAIAYYNSYVSVTDDRAKADAAEGRSKGYFVKSVSGEESNVFMISAGPQTVATIDMTNPAAVTWYGTLLQRAIDMGYDGWMLDFGEYLRADAKMFDGRLGWEAHNLFPVLYQKATWDYMRKVKGDDFMYFARAGYTGTQAYIPIHWSGDPAASFDDVKGLPAQVRGGVNAGISGIPYWGSDISGYTCQNDPPADKEVYLRWVEFGAFSPDMHHENACSGLSQGKKWELWDDDETIQVYGDYARLHTRLLPYLYSAADEAAKTGVPIMRHPWLVHPTVKEAWGVDLEYYFGPAFYVAPVVRRGALKRSTWLPPGTWADWWTLAKVAGGATIERDAPLALLPLWQRSGTLVAMLDPSIETLAPATEPTVVTLDKVKDVLDVRGVMDAGNASALAKLVDGAALTAKLSGAAALPTGFTQAATEGDLLTCSNCGRLDPTPDGGVRVRVNGTLGAKSSITAGGLVLESDGGPARRVRWDVVVLP
jgi:alpha-glucosidase (family GH31 glycosyl hydrolase)